MADIGPLAVSVRRQKTGLGGRIMRCLEAQYDITSVGVVSCRTDILPFYQRRGYRTFQQLPLEQVRIPPTDIYPGLSLVELLHGCSSLVLYGIRELA